MQKLAKITGKIAYIATQAILRSSQLFIDKSPAIDKLQPCLFAFWHGKQFLPALLLRHLHNTPLFALISPSKDGDILSECLEPCGYTIIRGSSRSNNKAAALAMYKKLKQGYSGGFAIDGPIGPIYVPKPGIVFLAQKTGLPIIPLTYASNKQWIFTKAWDKFELPKPCNKLVFTMGEPFIVDKNTSISDAQDNLSQLLAKYQAQSQQTLANWLHSSRF